MLPSVPLAKRVTPIAGWSIVVTFFLIGAALFATVWTTRSTVIDASSAVQRGAVAAVSAKVRADLRDLRGDILQEDLVNILDAHTNDGLRYIAMYEGDSPTPSSAVGTPRDLANLIQLDLRPGPRRGRARERSPDDRHFAIEVEHVAARELVDSSNRTLLVGGLAAAALLGVAIVMIRREGRRRAEERAAEHERRLASLGEMSAVLAHEIKNPLASLKGNAQLLAQMLPADDKTRRKADRVVDEAVRLEQLTIDLLQFVRTGAIARTPTDAVALVREVVGDRAAIEAAQAPASWSLDGARIREVIANLVDNAIAAGPPVTVGVAADGDRLVITVADRGPGVPEAERDKIFEPFVTGKTRGTGLGLAVTKRIVELHGGAIAVLSNPGGGALFRVAIPKG